MIEPQTSKHLQIFTIFIIPISRISKIIYWLFQTALCNISLDNPGKLSPHDIVSYILEYFPTDTLLFHTDVSECFGNF